MEQGAEGGVQRGLETGGLLEDFGKEEALEVELEEGEELQLAEWVKQGLEVGQQQVCWEVEGMLAGLEFEVEKGSLRPGCAACG